MTNFDQLRLKYIEKDTFGLNSIIYETFFGKSLFQRYLSIPQKIALASVYLLHQKSQRSQSPNQFYNQFCKFQFFKDHFLMPTKVSETPKIVQMCLFQYTSTSAGQNLSSGKLPVYLPHPNFNPYRQTCGEWLRGFWVQSWLTKAILRILGHGSGDFPETFSKI